MSRRTMVILVVVACLSWRCPGSSESLDSLKKNQTIGDLRVDNLYANDSQIMGTKLKHSTGAPVYLLQIETVPQVFMWVDTPTTSNTGIPHSLEHLLSSKGTKGRYSNLLTEMRFSRRAAATFRDYNFYSFSSGTGLDGFFEQFDAWLDALYQPDFTDVEAEREFYHFGVSVDAMTKKMSLIEKGTVYDEMQAGQGVYSYEFELNKRIWGAANPFAFYSGGVPDEMRQVTPGDIRRFHADHYRLGPTTGFIFALDPRENPIAFLQRISSELTKFSGPRPSQESHHALTEPKYPIQPSADKEIKIYPFPSNNDKDYCDVRFAWKPVKTESQTEVKLLQLFFSALADGDKSLLYRSVVDSKTRDLDSGAADVGASVFLQNSPYFPAAGVELNGIDGNRMTPNLVEQLRSRLSAMIHEISEYPDNSARLAAFNQLVSLDAKARRRSESVWFKSAPQFGLNLKRGWKEYLEYLEMDSAFVRSFSDEVVWNEVGRQIGSGKNIWRDLIQKFGLLEVPYATASVPSPQLLQKIEEERKDRIAKKAAQLMEQFGVKDEQQALGLFAQQEATETAEIDKIAARVPRPHLGAHVPLTPDEDIRYTQFRVGTVPAVASLFDRAPTIDLGLSFDLRQIPAKYYKYLPILPRCLDSLGLKTRGGVISYADLLARTQTEVNDFSIRYEFNPASHRADLTIRASMADPDEFRRGLTLIREINNSNNLAPTNVARLRDLVNRRLQDEDAYHKGETDYPYMYLGYAFHQQGDLLYVGLASVFTRAHWDGRLQWLLHQPVPSEKIAKLSNFADTFLPSLAGMSGADASRKIEASNETGLNRELLEYWERNIPAFSEAELVDGLKRLTKEVQEDLRTGPESTIADLQELQHLVLTPENLHIDLAVDPSDIERVKASLSYFVTHFPHHVLRDRRRPRMDAESAPIMARLTKRYRLPARDFPWFVGLEDPRSTNASMVFFADYPGYTQLDHRALAQVLSANLVSGAGPHTFFAKTIQDGLAYSNGIVFNPGQRLVRYVAENSPDIVALMQLVNSTAASISELHDSSLVDYSLRGALPWPRSMGTSSERAIGLAHDIRDGNDPSKVRRFSMALLSLRNDPNLLEEITRGVMDALAPVLVDPRFHEQQKNAKSVFFFVGPDRLLAEAERRLPIPMLLRVYPSDYWID